MFWIPSILLAPRPSRRLLLQPGNKLPPLPPKMLHQWQNPHLRLQEHLPLRALHLLLPPLRCLRPLSLSQPSLRKPRTRLPLRPLLSPQATPLLRILRTLRTLITLNHPTRTQRMDIQDSLRTKLRTMVPLRDT